MQLDVFACNSSYLTVKMTASVSHLYKIHVTPFGSLVWFHSTQCFCLDSLSPPSSSRRLLCLFFCKIVLRIANISCSRQVRFRFTSLHPPSLTPYYISWPSGAMPSQPNRWPLCPRRWSHVSPMCFWLIGGYLIKLRTMWKTAQGDTCLFYN